VIIRNFEYLLALNQEQHFSRAAAKCSVSQPTLSAGIKQLEEDMGAQIVKRGRRFEGLTPEGERVLAWAQQMLDDCQRLKRELSSFREQAMDGPFHVGASPATIALASVMSFPFAAKAPAVKLSVETMPVEMLGKALRSGQIDIALSYLNETPEDGLAHHHLYRERMQLLSPEFGLALSSVTVEQTTTQPLCLLRSCLPASLEARLKNAASILWTDSVTILEASLATGRYSTVLPQSSIGHLSAKLPVRAYPLKGDDAQTSVGFITNRVDPMPTLLHMWIELAHTPDVVKSIRGMLNSHKSFAKSRPA
jgi:DNA-binding transcriptional LysR family regulator